MLYDGSAPFGAPSSTPQPLEAGAIPGARVEPVLADHGAGYVVHETGICETTEVAGAAHAVGAEGPLPPGWDAALNESLGERCFYNVATGVCVFGRDGAIPMLSFPMNWPTRESRRLRKASGLDAFAGPTPAPQPCSDSSNGGGLDDDGRGYDDSGEDDCGDW